MQRDTCVCVFLKPPVAGTVKTRLVPAVGPDGAAALAEAFFHDTWDCVQSLDWAVPIVASTELPQASFLRQENYEIWLQGEGDLGARIEKILAQALTQTHFAVALGADSPGIPKRLLEEAHRKLQTADAVLGPCEDGGFYLLGIRRCPSQMLANLPWSQDTTFASTLDRLRTLGMETQVLETWFDVDRPEDLERIAKLHKTGALHAPNTAKTLNRLHDALAHAQASTCVFSSDCGGIRAR